MGRNALDWARDVHTRALIAQATEKVGVHFKAAKTANKKGDVQTASRHLSEAEGITEIIRLIEGKIHAAAEWEEKENSPETEEN